MMFMILKSVCVAHYIFPVPVYTWTENSELLLMIVILRTLLNSNHSLQDIIVDGCSLGEDSGYLQQVILNAFDILKGLLLLIK